jgi:hypothetical protein
MVVEAFTVSRMPEYDLPRDAKRVQVGLGKQSMFEPQRASRLDYMARSRRQVERPFALRLHH